MSKFFKLKGMAPNEAVTKLNLPALHEDFVVYIKTTKRDDKHAYQVTNIGTVCPNFQAYEDKYNEIVPDDIPFDELSSEAQFLINELSWHDDFIQAIEDYLYLEDFLYSNAGKPGDVQYFALKQVVGHWTTDYFGEIDFDLDYKSSRLDREEVPADILAAWDDNVSII